jgi:hypothetical protein
MITRRGLFGALLGGGAGMALSIVGRKVGRPYGVGPLTIERHLELKDKGIDLHVFWNGEDVTKRCSFADNTPGAERADLFKVDGFGKFYKDPDTKEIAREIVRGAGVEIRRV